MSKANITRTEAGDIRMDEQLVKLAYLQTATKIGEHGGVTTMDSKLFSRMVATQYGLLATTNTGNHLVPWANVKTAHYA